LVFLPERAITKPLEIEVYEGILGPLGIKILELVRYYYNHLGYRDIVGDPYVSGYSYYDKD
jgi:hypothetical protein